MKDDLATAAEPPATCRHLRTKMMHVSSDWLARQEDFPSAVAAWWCLRTMGPGGPDDCPALLESCTAKRRCFEAGG